MIRLGIPSKGRLAQPVEALLDQAGLRFRRPDRHLVARVRDLDVEIAFLRAEDVPLLCAEGALDLGISGSDLVEESGAELDRVLELGLGRCRLALCVPEASSVRSPGELAGARIATSFPVATERFFAAQGIAVRVVSLGGSIEGMTALGVAEAVVDLVESGSTLLAQRLRVLAELGSHEAVLFRRPGGTDDAATQRVLRRIEGVVIARAYGLLEYNVRREQLPEAEAITPGFESPTVSALEDPAWCAVRVMVPRAQVLEAMEKLESLGATAILLTDIQNCRL